MDIIIRQIYKLGELYHQFLKFPRKSAQIILSTPRGIILVKPTYDQYLYFPGGGIKTHEKPITAVVREVREELSLNLKPSSTKLFHKFQNHRFGWDDSIWLFTCSLNYHQITNLCPQNREIKQIVFVDRHNFQQFCLSPATCRRLKEYFKMSEHISNNW